MTAPMQVRGYPAVPATPQVPEQKHRPFVVATDGTQESDGAIVLAAALAASANSNLHAVSVCEDVLPSAEMSPLFPPASYLEDPGVTRANRWSQVSDQMLRVLGAGHGAWIAVRSGGVGSTIASYATEYECDMIIAGRGRHGVVDRILGEEHMLRLLRATRCPVIMVEPGLQTLPRRVVIGLDFSERDKAAAEVARKVMAPDAKVFLVHVKPDLPYAVPTSGGWLTSYGDAMRNGIEEMKAQLALPASHSVETVLLTGHPGKSLADFARRADADLIAVGIHGLGFIHRLVVGSTTAYLLRSAPCSVLATTLPDIYPR